VPHWSWTVETVRGMGARNEGCGQDETGLLGNLLHMDGKEWKRGKKAYFQEVGEVVIAEGSGEG